MRSIPSRSGVPGATIASASCRASVGGPGVVMERFYLEWAPCNPTATKASVSVATRTSEMPSTPLAELAGTIARVNPSRAASARRREAWATWRNSPAKPISPNEMTIGGKRMVDQCADDGQAHRQIAARLGQPHAADGGREHLVLTHRHPGSSLEHGQQQRQPAGIEALSAAPWRHTGVDLVGQRLHLDQQRAVALERGRDRRPGDTGAPIGEEQAAGVGHPDQPALDHLEHAQARWSNRTGA